MKFNPINIIHILVIWQSLLFAIVLNAPKYSKIKSNKFLSLLLLTLGLHFIYNFLYTNGLYLNILPPYSCSYGFLYGPLFFLYIKFHLEKDVRFRALDWLHFAPFLAILVLTSIEIIICRYVAVMILPVMLTYSIFSFRAISIYVRTIPHVSSKNFNSETKWLKTISVFMIVIILLDLLQSQIPYISIWHLQIQLEVVVQTGLLVFVSMINYQGLKNPHSFQQISESDIAIGNLSDNKSIQPTIDKNSLNELAHALEKYMEVEKPYLNADLNINMLAAALQVSEKSISQSVNHIIGSNFSDYINSYRIEYATLKLKNDKEKSLSIKETMYDVGFNSRSVFNSAFKKKTGLTPSEYQKNHE